MSVTRGLAVVVPAHDEQALVGACLDAVLVACEQVQAQRPDLATSVTVVLDACHDDTARIVAEFVGVDAVTLDLGCVGAARAAGTAHALGALDLPPDRVWTAHTDADSRVPPEWLTALLAAADAGVDAVLGTVTLDDGVAPAVLTAWAGLNPPSEGHPYVHGANLGVRASTLAAVGGWRALATGEDVDLAARLQAEPGVVVRSTAAHPVVTSARADGRAPEGLSSYLRELDVA